MTTRKDFQRAANLVGAIKDHNARATCQRQFIAFFRGNHPRFDVDRFTAWVDEVHADLYGPPPPNPRIERHESYTCRCGWTGKISPTEDQSCPICDRDIEPYDLEVP